MKCEQCHKEHDRKRFCCNKCKDRWHNLQRVFSMLGEQAQDVEDMAGDGYAAGWDEDGWRDDDSGVCAA